ncbi:MAG: hypothetical protein KBD63_02030 [Bacteriovoracaceae bacterium]|nr:hypothetical protein [Bacteriovoracaceae bacterium]
MPWNKFITTLFTLMSTLSWANLPELLTKQSIRNIRYFSEDAKFTYFQKLSGELILSTNYANISLLKGDAESRFIMSGTHHRKNLIIEHYENYFKNNRMRKTAKIYVTAFGKSDVRFIAEGINAKLHLDDTWISYYVPHLKKLYWKSLIASQSYSVTLLSTGNDYFIPEIVMPSSRHIIYSDFSKEGYATLYILNPLAEAQKKLEQINPDEVARSQIFYKASHKNTKLELCLLKDKIIAGELGIDDNLKGSSIFSFPVETLNSKEKNILYSSKLNDLGHLICEEKDHKIYFIKSISQELKLPLVQTDVARLDPVTKQVEILSHLGSLTQLIFIDGKIITPYRGKLLIVKGTSFKDDQLGTTL